MPELAQALRPRAARHRVRVLSARDAARAIDAIRRGWPIAVGELRLLAVETADDLRLAEFEWSGLLISPQRAVTLKLANQRDGADPAYPVNIARAPWLDLAAARAVADPALDLAAPLKGPFTVEPRSEAEAGCAALELARLAGVLPAFFIGAAGMVEADVSPKAVAAYVSPGRIELVARARLPVEHSEAAEIAAFRSSDDAVEHVALVIGAPNGRPPLVRLHSECLTGDAFGSLKCDCGPQLNAAIARIAAEGWGVLLYLRQEGRGIGLINKLRAYALQDQGYDTVDANVRLGFAVDARDFAVAARMLTLLGQDEIRLLTNNPAKVDALAANGIAVIEHVAHALPANLHNARYLATKRDRTGHQL